MEDLHRTAADYDDSATLLIESCLLHVATVLGDLMRDSVVVVGGLVPHLLIPQGNLPPGADVHAGTPGVEMAFSDRVSVALTGRTLDNEVAQRDVWVCGPAAFVALKALAFDGRGFPKDAYDLFYVLRESNEKATETLGILQRDFLHTDAVGPVRAASFLAQKPDDALRADVAAFVRDYLDAIGTVMD